MRLFLFILLCFSSILASEKTCITQWIQEENKKYTPPKSLEIIYIELLGKNVDSLKFRTQNNSSIYKYSEFININNNLGISFKAENGNIIDLFTNGDLFIWKNDKSNLKAKCSNLKLDIEEIH
ncbi:hypothetical protein [Aliarcobacter cryaerophilus]|uniref:hypothetical protein n=1 Tax=Aliarcobacter cryaerophilus TaxID=28198 RepID=UPI0021B5C870|nr:hypothetical protein [Aliarcobacter cryaerophilus]MCT7472789.1 hypothetical protein [Aliarcobacter cryaerophilus]